MKKILFQGDSITDAWRGREGWMHLGCGFPTLIASELGYTIPEQFEIINRGIGGNRSVDLLARWKNDCLELKPDYLTFMIGVNDVWHEIDSKNGVTAERYEKFLRMMIEDVKNTLPDTKMIIMEPYITHGEVVDKNWDYFRFEIDKRIAIVRQLTSEYNIPCIHLQEEFDRVLEFAPADNWTIEGIHPTPAGHKLIANAWLKIFNNGNF